MKITFLKNYTVKDADGTTYEEGKSYDLPDASAQHFLSRGVATESQSVKAEKKDESQKDEKKPASKK